MGNKYRVYEMLGLIVAFLVKKPDRKMVSMLSNPQGKLNPADDVLATWLSEIVIDHHEDFARYLETGNLTLDGIEIDIPVDSRTKWLSFLVAAIEHVLENGTIAQTNILPHRLGLIDKNFVPLPNTPDAIRFGAALDLIHATPDTVLSDFQHPELLVIKEPTITHLFLETHILGNVFYIVENVAGQLVFEKPEFDLTCTLNKEVVFDITPTSICSTGKTLASELQRLGFPEDLDFNLKKMAKLSFSIDLDDSVIRSGMTVLSTTKVVNSDPLGLLEDAFISNTNSGFVIDAVLTYPEQQRIPSGWEQTLRRALVNRLN